MFLEMVVVESSARQHRAAAVALFLIAALTSAMIAIAWAEYALGSLLLPLVVAYLLFNVGFLGAAAWGGLQSKGARLGAAAVLLNLAAMLLSDFFAVWTALSVGAVLMALTAGYMLLKGLRASPV